jgi:hypothetical protein
MTGGVHREAFHSAESCAAMQRPAAKGPMQPRMNSWPLLMLRSSG